ncbi:glycoside hydrolase family 3 N-terminal domain-containing protein [Cesiribacter sp. SM1]|uniref:glycoside hydrolase family 3 N-terminal domain-containing protein n=1 Tax=Cesiribacter sp. SM1 TaxID=2861196 RepID=UPI001CD2CEE8|nr:glycoside hydrolase family 3 N-terminal domain-containing protein [Cesiribacter sp. SM1]
MRIIYFLLCLFLVSLSSVQAQELPVYLDATRPLDQRVNDLIATLSLEEKAQQMMYNSPAIPRLSIPAYNWWNEALHGVGRSGVATVFPQAIGLGATFDDHLLQQVAAAISDEARAMHNASVAKDYHLKYAGLTFWTPNINIFRDPRWGRGQETYGEDPFLTSRMGVAFVKGLQGDNPDYLKVAACAKHFAVHSGPERLRHEFNAQASLKDMRETYLPAFKALVQEANVESVMCAYNSTNGEPCCANNFLLNQVLRREWGFTGHVVSDCWALVDFYEGHKVVANEVEAAALALKSGVNLNCGSVYPYLVEAVKQGLVTEAEIDARLAVLLRTKFKLGMFDPAAMNPYNTISADVINSAEHRSLAREAATKSMVLLKNNGVLPLENDLPLYFVTGPNAASIDALLGNYYGVNPQMVTILEGLAAGIEKGSQLQYKPGVLLNVENVNPIDWTTGDAKNASATIVVLGLTGMLEGEEGESIASAHYGDRLDYNLPPNQIEFLKKLREGHEKPLIAIITGGSPMNLAEVHELADAVVLAWYPGEEGGNAVADVVFGKASPSGKLPITFPKSLVQLPPYEDYSMEGRTYRYMKEEPMYPFGYGLSYASFTYSDLELSAAKIRKNQSVTVEATITNTGKRAGEEVVQLYLTDEESSVRAPLYSLVGFKRLQLAPGASGKVSFTITPDMMSLYNEKGEKLLERGSFRVHIGGSSPGSRSEQLGMSKPATGVFQLR